MDMSRKTQLMACSMYTLRMPNICVATSRPALDTTPTISKLAFDFGAMSSIESPTCRPRAVRNCSATSSPLPLFNLGSAASGVPWIHSSLFMRRNDSGSKPMQITFGGASDCTPRPALPPTRSGR